ncbi:hypothetical protein OG204_32925 [Streptomyces sp. NBC_01387]|uniref:hypothetical protein n=1 Tax=unclassified Streptomyces TaxID=2593676 RepID=UPI0020255759|nr:MULTISPECIES: hypothetical protein [unclassified Streptomyces]MCX4553615.1 hypothetical protein [Streptomyces sp. NBC_01500]WSV52605.1 hypothetical protein OG282_02305 [Streptomyces sp. NBC_01014]
MRRTRPTRLATIAALAVLAPLTPLLLAEPATAAPAPLTIENPGFEEGTDGWTLTSGAGVASNKPHGGSKLAYLDAGHGKQVSQKIKVPGDGTYDFSAWIATGGTAGTFFARVNGSTAASVVLPERPTYARYTLSRISLKRGDELELAFGSGNGWINADDLMVSPSAPVDPVVSSSDPEIVEMFNWAKRKANSWVQQPGTNGPLNVDENNSAGTGTGTYGPSYWAGYAHRSGYYSRDMAHQLSGASVLGLHDANKAMLSAFAASATEEHGYYPAWSFNFDNKTKLSIDYHSPTSFVREVPATFELVEKANEAYRWSGDSAYVDDDILWDFYRHATKEFIELHDGGRPNGVAEGTGKGIFAGAASYNEAGDEPLAEAGDAIGAQYQAFRAMSALARSKGDGSLAEEFRKKADKLKSYFNSTWSGTGSGESMIRAYTTDGEPVTGWGKENSWFMPMKQIMEPGARTDAYLDYIDQQASGEGKPDNIEAISYLPDTFFAYEHSDTAWKWMRYVYDKRNDQHPVSKQGPNGDYPEVSYTLLGQTVEGLMGVEPDAPSKSLSTRSRMPSGMNWLQIKDIKVGGNTFTLRHDRASRSTLTNDTGSDSYTWEAQFPGKHPVIKIDGKKRAAHTKRVNGKTYSYVRVSVAPNQSVSAEVA